MKYKRFIPFLRLFILIVFSTSCSSDLDFNQIKDAKLEPTIVANLSNFDLPAKDFIVNGVEQNLVVDAQDFDVFRDRYFKSYLKRADFFFEINNTINRSFTLDVNLLDENDAVLYTKRFIIPAYNGTQNVVSKTDIFQNNKLDLLKQTKRLGYVLYMANGVPLTVNSPGSLKLRSSATVYLAIQ